MFAVRSIPNDEHCPIQYSPRCKQRCLVHGACVASRLDCPHRACQRLTCQQPDSLTEVDTVLQMLVTDLHHLLDLPRDTPGPATRLADHLSNVVRAATAGDAGIAWESALPCRRRLANRACPGRIVVLRAETEAPVRWQCSACHDAGMINNWTDSPFDLRRRTFTLVEVPNKIVIKNEVAAALRDLQLLDTNCERLVFGIRADHDCAVLAATDDDLEELIGAVAAEANHEPNRHRQQRLDAAVDALNDATAADS